MAALANKSDRLPIRTPEDIVLVRQHVRKLAQGLGFSLVDQTKVVTAASELARNTLIYGKGGWVTVELLERSGRRGLKAIFEDRGPGIPNIDEALRDGFTTGGGLGLGLGGAKRLSNDFEIQSRPGEGTRVAVTRWKA